MLHKSREQSIAAGCKLREKKVHVTRPLSEKSQVDRYGTTYKPRIVCDNVVITAIEPTIENPVTMGDTTHIIASDDGDLLDDHYHHEMSR